MSKSEIRWIMTESKRKEKFDKIWTKVENKLKKDLWILEMKRSR